MKGVGQERNRMRERVGKHTARRLLCESSRNSSALAKYMQKGSRCEACYLSVLQKTWKWGSDRSRMGRKEQSTAFSVV